MDHRELISQLERDLEVVKRLLLANPESPAYSVEWGYLVSKEGIRVIYSERDQYDSDSVYPREHLVPWEHIDDPEPVIAAYNLAKEIKGKAAAAERRAYQERMYEQLKRELGK